MSNYVDTINDRYSPIMDRRQSGSDSSESDDERTGLTEAKENYEAPSGLRWTRYHVSVFFLTFISYALYHVSRKTFSNVKTSISNAWTPQNLSESQFLSYDEWNSHSMCKDGEEAKSFLAVLDACFLAAYAIGLYISGTLGDRFDPRIVLSVGMCSSAIAFVLFGFLPEVLHFYHKPYYVVMWLTSGFLQSSGWPVVVCVMGNWFGRGSRGFILGLWSSCASVGNIIGTYLASGFLSYGYEYTFLVNGLFLFCGGIVIFFGLVSAPREVGMPEPEESVDPKEIHRPAHMSAERPEAIGFFKAFMLPGVLAYSLAYACLKLVNYSFFFWLPYYLTNAFGWEESDSDKLSTWYDWGGIFGGVVGGIITDLMGCRAPITVGMLFAAMFSLWGYLNSPNNKLVNGILMTLTGFLIGGPANLISAAVSADLGRSPEIAGNAEAISTVTGILDGTGSIGASLGQLLVPLFTDKKSWYSVFYMFIVMTFLTCVCLWKPFFYETRDFIRRVRNRRYGNVSEDFAYQPLPGNEEN